MNFDDNAFFDEIIIEDYSEGEGSENSEKYKNEGNTGKENKKKITRLQREKLISAMDGTHQISKGKMKSDDTTVRLLREWDQLTKDLNVLGPPHHTSLDWRRLWTKMKSNKKRKCLAGILCNRNENKMKRRNTSIADKWHPNSSVINVEPVESDKQCYRNSTEVNNVITTEPVESKKRCIQKSNDGDSLISTVEPMESEPDKRITDKIIQQDISCIVHAIASLSERNASAFETMNKKLDVLVTKQEILNDNLIALAMAVGFDIHSQESTE